MVQHGACMGDSVFSKSKSMILTNLHLNLEIMKNVSHKTVDIYQLWNIFQILSFITFVIILSLGYYRSGMLSLYNFRKTFLPILVFTICWSGLLLYIYSFLHQTYKRISLSRLYWDKWEVFHLGIKRIFQTQKIQKKEYKVLDDAQAYFSEHVVPLCELLFKERIIAILEIKKSLHIQIPKDDEQHLVQYRLFFDSWQYPSDSTVFNWLNYFVGFTYTYITSLWYLIVHSRRLNRIQRDVEEEIYKSNNFKIISNKESHLDQFDAPFVKQRISKRKRKNK